MRFAKASAMLQAGRTYKEVHAETGLSRATIWKVKTGQVEVNDNVAEAMRKCEVNKLTMLSARILDSIDSETIEKAPLGGRMVAYGIATDKRELLAGRPTSRVGMIECSNAELEAEIEAARAEVEAWKSGKVVNAEVRPS